MMGPAWSHLAPCKSCGFVHRKRNGALKYYVGALVCPVYVELCVEDASHWGFRSSPPPKTGEEFKLARCNAPDSFVCYFKGSTDERGFRRCFSSDGFPSETRADQKLKETSRGWGLNEAALCEFIGPYRRRTVKKRGPRIRSHGSKNFIEGRPNLMPGSGDVRKDAVYKELWRRIELLKARNVEVTFARVALLSGHSVWANRDLHGFPES